MFFAPIRHIEFDDFEYSDNICAVNVQHLTHMAPMTKSIAIWKAVMLSNQGLPMDLNKLVYTMEHSEDICPT